MQEGNFGYRVALRGVLSGSTGAFTEIETG